MDMTDTEITAAAETAPLVDSADDAGSHPDVQEGRSRLTLPPLSPSPEEALAAAEAAKTEPDLPAPPTYAEMLHLLPR
jgi:hypothetical protein